MDAFKRREASVLAQLRTGMARLNGYLHQIGAAESCLRLNKGNPGTLLLQVYDVGNTLNTNVRADRYKKRQPLLLARRESTIGPGAVDAKHESGQSNSQLCNSH